MVRRSIVVDELVFEEFSSQAERQNKTLFAFTNEALSIISKICAEGGNPPEIRRLWHSFSILKEIDAITLPSDLVDELIAKLYASDKELLLEMFRNLGSRLASLLKIAAEDLDHLSGIANDFIMLLPIKEFKIKNVGDNIVEVDIAGAGRRIESTECTSEFVKSILKGYGYDPTSQELNVGVLRLWALKRRQSFTQASST